MTPPLSRIVCSRSIVGICIHRLYRFGGFRGVASGRTNGRRQHPLPAGRWRVEILEYRTVDQGLRTVGKRGPRQDLVVAKSPPAITRPTHTVN